MRWTVVAVVEVHGLIHPLGAAKGFGWAEVTIMNEPISAAMGATWFAAAALVVAAGVLLAIEARWWWVVDALAVVVSPGMNLTSWSDAQLGTVVNVILRVAVIYGYRSHRPPVTESGT